MQADSAPDVGIFSFPNGLVTEDQGFSWQMVEKAGADFLGALERFIESNQVGFFSPLNFITNKVFWQLDNHPIFLAAHSTGGIILKRVSFSQNALWPRRLSDSPGFVY